MTAHHTLEGAASEVLTVLTPEDPDLPCLLAAKTQRCLTPLEEPTSPIGTALSLAVPTLHLRSSDSRRRDTGDKGGRRKG